MNTDARGFDPLAAWKPAGSVDRRSSAFIGG
jgi:hypothetical protein